MSQETKPNTGALFKNKRQRNDNDPRYQGNLNVDGKDFWISAWLNTSKVGDKYFSLRVNPKKSDPGSAPKEQATHQDGDENLPF